MSDNPFLLPPAKRSTTAPGVPDSPPAADPDHYIAVPASVESATHRITRADPTISSIADQPDDQVAEETRVAPAATSASQAWVLALPDGTRLPLTSALVMGRNPAPLAERPDADLLALADQGKTVSKTHALLEPSDEGVRVRDLHSTNGVAVDAPGGRKIVVAGAELVAPVGSTILLGSFAIGVVAR